MHYSVLGNTVCTERTAKPKKQASSYLSFWIRNHAQVHSALDYGCGRLRYASDLASIASSVTLVDSDEQLSRTQTLGGSQTTLRDYVNAQMHGTRLQSIREFYADERKYDFVLCANVLPMIPNARVRACVLRSLSVRLKKKGECLFVSQFRNSYFKEIQHFPGATRYLDGWAVIRPKQRSTYFGIMPAKKVEVLVKKNGFRVVDSWIKGQSAYVLCTS